VINLFSDGEQRSSHRHSPQGKTNGDRMKIPANIIDGTASIKQLKTWMYTIEDFENEDAHRWHDVKTKGDHIFMSHLSETAIATYEHTSGEQKILTHILKTVAHRLVGDEVVSVPRVSIANVYQSDTLTSICISEYAI